MPLQDREGLPRLKNERSMERLVKTVYAIIKVVSPDEPDLTTINQLQYTDVSSKFAPRKLVANRNPDGSRILE